MQELFQCTRGLLWRGMQTMDVANIIATGIAAFAGGVGAFGWERRKREDDVKAARGDALLRAGSTLFALYTLATAVRKQFCDEVVDSPRLMVFLKPILEVDKPPVRFDVASLGFLLGT